MEQLKAYLPWYRVLSATVERLYAVSSMSFGDPNSRYDWSGI